MNENLERGHTIDPSGIIRRHRTISGTTLCFNASGAPRAISLHAPAEIETITATGSTFGKMPAVPSPDDVDDNRVFLDGERVASSAGLTPGFNGHNWHLVVSYSYVLLAPEGLTSEMPGAKLSIDPTVTIDPNNDELPQVNLPASVFVTGLLGKSPTP